MTDKIYSRPTRVTSADQALQLLREGNNRFTSGETLGKELGENKRQNLLQNGQKPFAVVLTCSDSRVPPEILFDQGLGDLFVIRVAGNVIDETVMSSLLYGAEHLKVPLIIVLGHSDCGAVKATLAGEIVPGISNKLKPLADKLTEQGLSGDSLCTGVEDANISSTLTEIKTNPQIKRLLDQGHLTVLGAKYYLASGKVEFHL